MKNIKTRCIGYVKSEKRLCKRKGSFFFFCSDHKHLALKYSLAIVGLIASLITIATYIINGLESAKVSDLKISLENQNTIIKEEIKTLDRKDGFLNREDERLSISEKERADRQQKYFDDSAFTFHKDGPDRIEVRVSRERYLTGESWFYRTEEAQSFQKIIDQKFFIKLPISIFEVKFERPNGQPRLKRNYYADLVRSISVIFYREAHRAKVSFNRNRCKLEICSFDREIYNLICSPFTEKVFTRLNNSTLKRRLDRSHCYTNPNPTSKPDPKQQYICLDEENTNFDFVSSNNFEIELVTLDKNVMTMKISKPSPADEGWVNLDPVNENLETKLFARVKEDENLSPIFEFKFSIKPCYWKKMSSSSRNATRTVLVNADGKGFRKIPNDYYSANFSLKYADNTTKISPAYSFKSKPILERTTDRIRLKTKFVALQQTNIEGSHFFDAGLVFKNSTSVLQPNLKCDWDSELIMCRSNGSLKWQEAKRVVVERFREKGSDFIELNPVPNINAKMYIESDYKCNSYYHIDGCGFFNMTIPKSWVPSTGWLRLGAWIEYKDGTKEDIWPEVGAKRIQSILFDRRSTSRE